MNNPEIIRRVGECAQNTIYISWESAVKNAYARYGEVIENYRLGRYPEHASLTDKSFSKISELMALRSQQREREEAVRSELRSGYEEIYSSYQELWTDLKGELRKLEEQQEKIYRYMDRFL